MSVLPKLNDLAISAIGLTKVYPRGREQVRALAQTGQRRGIHLVPLRPQKPRDGLVAPAAVAAAVNQDVGGHRLPFPQSRRARAECRAARRVLVQTRALAG